MRHLILPVLAVAVIATGCAQVAVPEPAEPIEGVEVLITPDKMVETRPDGCRIEKFTVPSPSMGREIKVVIVLPPAYGEEPARRYPVLHTLHGARAPYATWSEMSPLRKALSDRPMIVTCFDGDPVGMYIDSTQKPESQFTTFFFDEFVPYVAEHYRTNGVRGVTGFSMGGYGAFHYMLTRPEMLASVSSLSGAFAEDVSQSRGLRELLGDFETNREAYRRCDIYGRLRERVAAGERVPPMMLHCGTEDFLLEANRKFLAFLVEQNKLIRERLEPQAAGIEDQRERRNKMSQLMAEHGLSFMYKESPGGHNWEFWRDASEEVVEFHWKSFQRPAK